MNYNIIKVLWFYGKLNDLPLMQEYYIDKDFKIALTSEFDKDLSNSELKEKLKQDFIFLEYDIINSKLFDDLEPVKIEINESKLLYDKINKSINKFDLIISKQEQGELYLIYEILYYQINNPMDPVEYDLSITFKGFLDEIIKTNEIKNVEIENINEG